MTHSSIPDHVIEEIRERADVLEVIGRYVSLKKAWADCVGPCPFHSENKPSFTVHPDKGFYKCFGCGAGGDVFDFLQKAAGIPFLEAVEKAAGSVGVNLDGPASPPPSAAKQKEREDYRDIQQQLEKEQKLKTTALARTEWGLMADVGSSNYLKNKKIVLGPARIFKQVDSTRFGFERPEDKKDKPWLLSGLAVPLQDVKGRLWNLQLIVWGGKKKFFLTNGHINGLFCPIGGLAGDEPLIICEGFATGVSIAVVIYGMSVRMSGLKGLLMSENV